MNFDINPGNNAQRNQHAHLPLHVTRYGSFSDSVDSDDPLVRDALTTNHSQSPVKQPGSPTPSGRRSVTVVLNKSPAQLDAYRDVSVEEDEEDVDAQVQSDLNQQGNPRTLFKPVNAVQKSITSESQKGASSDATSTTPARRRGRPKGSTNKLKGLPPTAAASRQARQVKPRPHPIGFPKRRGRPPKLPSPPPETIYYNVDAPFFPFLCEWRDCKAELHNLDTLRRHVYIVHGESVRCLWGKCGHREDSAEFEDDEGFKEHVEEAHLVPFSWHVGDGPNNFRDRNSPKKGVLEEDEIPDYLKDEHGNQVTPSIRYQQEEDIFTWKKNRRKLKELIARMNDNLPDEPDEGEEIERQGV
ncbi:uncharacterized protein QYS62_009300 [Fusarium acuminatum]|uniref:C2H2-type domain-containing protein n=1 Tax=Fusarium acuminatum TaxID=5515 RepID=A0ABZ2X8I0_9HYPO